MSMAHRGLAPAAREVYGTNPAEYDRGRPDYPDRVYEVLAERCGLRRGARVLEIGPGPGTATRHLLAAGADVVVVEPDPAMARYLADSNAGQSLRVIESTFEEAGLEDNQFDLVTAATSFHWVDPETGWTKLGQVVRPGGWVALWWTIFGDASRSDAFRDATEPLIRETFSAQPPAAPPGTEAAQPPTSERAPPRPMFELDLERRQVDLREQAGLESVEGELIPWTFRMDAVQVRALYGSTIRILRLDAVARKPLLDDIERIATEDFGGVVERPFVTSLFTGRKPA